jgi:hypothetical protein
MDHVKSFERIGSDIAIEVGPIPGRTRIAICVVRGSIHSVVAYARSEAHAMELVEGLRDLTGARTDV